MTARLLLIALLVLPACGTTFATPAGYAALEPVVGDYAFEAVSPENCRYRIRRLSRGEDSDAAYWEAAITNHLVRTAAYTPVSAADLTTVEGLSGRELLFEATSGGVDYRYWIGFLLDGSRLWLIEAGGVASTFEADLDAVRDAARAIR